MNEAGEQFLAGACLSQKKHRRVTRSGKRRLLDDLCQARALSDDLVERTSEFDVFLEVRDVAPQTVLLLEERPEPPPIFARAEKARIGDRDRGLGRQRFEACDIQIARRTIGVESRRVQPEHAKSLVAEHERHHEHGLQSRVMHACAVVPAVVVLHVGDEHNAAAGERETQNPDVWRDRQVAEDLAARATRADGAKLPGRSVGKKIQLDVAPKTCWTVSRVPSHTPSTSRRDVRVLAALTRASSTRSDRWSRCEAARRI